MIAHDVPDETSEEEGAVAAVTRRVVDWTEVGTGAGVALFGIIALIGSRGLAFINGHTLGPGLLPQSMAIALIVLGGALVVIGVRAKTPGTNPFVGKGAFRVLLMLASLFIFILTLPMLGFIVSGMLFLALVFFVVQRNFAWPAYANVIVLPLLFWVIFVKALRVPLPAGIFGF